MTERAVIVLEVDAGDAAMVAAALSDALRRESATTFKGRQSWGPLRAAWGPDAELVRDVFRDPESGGGRHVLNVEDDAWHLEHALVCRRAGLENCPMTRLAQVAVETDAVGTGHYRIWLDRNALRWDDV